MYALPKMHVLRQHHLQQELYADLLGYSLS